MRAEHGGANDTSAELLKRNASLTNFDSQKQVVGTSMIEDHRTGKFPFWSAAAKPPLWIPRAARLRYIVMYRFEHQRWRESGARNMNDEASYVCDSCGEEIVIPVDASAG